MLEWYMLHQAELQECWELARARQPLRQIQPLEVDAMTPLLESATYVEGHIVHLRFADGVEADVDLEAEIWGEVFEPLRDPAVFRQFSLDKELNTLSWATGADFAPEFLYERATQQGRTS